MATKPGHIVMGIEVPLEFRKEFTKPKAFWERLGQAYGVMASHMTTSEIADFNREFPKIREFVEDILQWENL